MGVVVWSRVGGMAYWDAWSGAQANIASEVIRNAKYYNSTHRKTQIRRTTQVYKDQDKNKDGAKKDLLLILSTKITTSIYKLSMPLYRTWAVTSKREPLSLPHSLSSL